MWPVWFPRPYVQFAASLVYDWVLSELLRRYLAVMPAAIWFIIGYRLCAALVPVYRKITNPRHCLLMFRGYFYNNATQQKINENTHSQEHGIGYSDHHCKKHHKDEIRRPWTAPAIWRASVR